jgi:outer membrane lipoprotein-sorting protein
MQFTKRIILAAALSLIGASSFAQDVNDIINKNIEAMGGKDKLSKLLSVYEENTTSVMGNDLNSKVWVLNGQGMRAEVEVMGSTIITVMTKDTGWMVNPMTGNSDPQPIPMEQVKQSAARMDLRGQFLNYAANGYTATLVGKEQLDGKDNYKVKLTKTGEGDLLFYIDGATYYVNKMVTTVKANGSDVTSEIAFTDYKTTPEGYVFPYTTTISNPQAGEIKSTITKVVPNQTIDPKLFQKP